MNLAKSPPAYSTDDQDRLRATLSDEDKRNLKRGQDIAMGANRLILTSPNGTQYVVVVSNAGALSATAL